MRILVAFLRYSGLCVGMLLLGRLRQSLGRLSLAERFHSTVPFLRD